MDSKYNSLHICLYRAMFFVAPWAEIKNLPKSKQTTIRSGDFTPKGMKYKSIYDAQVISTKTI